MRHGKKTNHLGRKTAHRRAMLSNMACSLIEHKRINTTTAKAKALKQFVEPLITRSKAENNKTADEGTHNRRIVFKSLRNKHAVTELFGAVAEKVGDRPGGYTRIIKLGNRLGDNADMAMIELVDFNEIYNAGKPKKKTTRRSRRSKTENAEAAPAASKETKTEAKPEPKAEAPVAEAVETAQEEVVQEAAEAKEEVAEAAAPEASKEEAPKAEGKEAADEDSDKKEGSDA
jgi:large subunit ribosomal protein L17